MPNMDPRRKLEMGRRVALKEITTKQAVEEYGCKNNVVWDARRKWLQQNTPQTVALPVKETTRPERPPADHALLDALEEENHRLHDEVRTLQKILMTVGRAL